MRFLYSDTCDGVTVVTVVTVVFYTHGKEGERGCTKPKTQENL